MSTLFGAGSLLLVAAAPGAGAAVAASSHQLFTLQNPELDEASGIVAGTASPGVLYAQNDSGDSARFFALNASTGATVATCTVPNATNVDWEDMAGGLDAAGSPSLWIGDIGDNDGVRSSITIYQVAEPQLAAGTPVKSCSTPIEKTWKLTYPDGAQNAESLMMNPTDHRLYIASKTFSGQSNVYRVPSDAKGGAQQVLEQVGTIQLGLTGTKGGPVGAVGGLMVTGGAFSPDGSLLVLRTYTDGYLWPVSGADVATALKQPMTTFPLPSQPQGEGIAVTGVTGAATAARQVGLITDSEKAGSGVFAVDVTLPAATAESPGSAWRATSNGAGPVDPITAAASGHGRAVALIVAAVVVIAALVAAGGVRVFRRARRP